MNSTTLGWLHSLRDGYTTMSIELCALVVSCGLPSSILCRDRCVSDACASMGSYRFTKTTLIALEGAVVTCKGSLPDTREQDEPTRTILHKHSPSKNMTPPGHQRRSMNIIVDEKTSSRDSKLRCRSLLAAAFEVWPDGHLLTEKEICMRAPHIEKPRAE